MARKKQLPSLATSWTRNPSADSSPARPSPLHKVAVRPRTLCGSQLNRLQGDDAGGADAL